MKYLLILCLFFVGCGSVSVRHTITLDEDGKVIAREFVYKRKGKLDLEGFKATINDDGTKEIEIGSSKGGSDHSEAILNFSKAAKDVAKKIP